MDFRLVSNYDPSRRSGYPPSPSLVRGLADREEHQVLLGVTGSGKTYTMAKVIDAHRPAGAGAGAQQDPGGAALFRVREFFPHNAVEYFVTYYDYYQPEAYVPAATSTSRKKRDQRPHRADAPVGDQVAVRAPRLHDRRLGRLHLRLGSPEAYYGMLLMLEKGQKDQARASRAAGGNPLRAQ